MSHCRGALTLVHVAASSVTADSKTHLHMDQLDRAMGMAMMMCFQHGVDIVHDKTTAVHNCSCNNAARKHHPQPVNVHEGSCYLTTEVFTAGI